MPSSLSLELDRTQAIRSTPGEFAETPRGRQDRELFAKAFPSPTTFIAQPVVANDDHQDLLATQSAIKGLLSKFSMHLSQQLREGLFAQTRRLISIEDWDEECELPSIDSYRTMLRCLVELQPKLRPSLALSDHGAFLGAWRSEEKSLVIEFRAQDRVHWIYCTATEGGSDRASGQTATKRMIELLTALDARNLVDGEA